MELLTVHGTLDKYHRQSWTRVPWEPSCSTRLWDNGLFKIKLYIWGLFQVYTHCYLFIFKESIFFKVPENLGDFCRHWGECGGSIQMWIWKTEGGGLTKILGWYTPQPASLKESWVSLVLRKELGGYYGKVERKKDLRYFKCFNGRKEVGK